ncbi:MAG: MgtC/SapB family protein, partial [Candidatus Krumholzibacteria bacterium]|nr:MgtC/SapB family protein [Candidatus Krumholzibacteria bacterium]
MSAEFVQYALRLVFALFIGGLIGIEREIKGKPAGMRTNMLMCMGSCLLMI